jgi:hypothetical protein
MLMMIFTSALIGIMFLKNELDKIGHNKFYLSGTMVNNGQINLDCGNNLEII